jgi:hypothetical protein
VAHHVLHQGNQLCLGIGGCAACAIMAAALMAMVVMMVIMAVVVVMMMVVVIMVMIVVMIVIVAMLNAVGMHVIMFVLVHFHNLLEICWNDYTASAGICQKPFVSLFFFTVPNVFETILRLFHP